MQVIELEIKQFKKIHFHFQLKQDLLKQDFPKFKEIKKKDKRKNQRV